MLSNFKIAHLAVACLLTITFHSQAQAEIGQATNVQATDSTPIKLGVGSWTGLAKVIVTVASDGTMTFTVDTSSPITITGISGTPTPTPTPPNTVLEKHKALTKAAAASITLPNKLETSAALSKLYITIAGLPVSERAQLAQATDIMFNALMLPQEWKEWKSKVDASLAQFLTLDTARAAWKVTGEALLP